MVNIGNKHCANTDVQEIQEYGNVGALHAILMVFTMNAIHFRGAQLILPHMHQRSTQDICELK